ncbi:metal ABC transporter permease [uncultured Dialister sp.]|uniref:metal ABC transporter permease n=1 Tax=uncultured Dialister sp. TaxID=278064 RepID=UPI0025E607B2|nr:metal ABC transporter permease [uncultured Dialister sp.]
MFSYSFIQNALFISLCIAILCPCIGIFLVLKRYSMIGDTLAHSSLAGVTLGLLFRDSPVLTSFIFTALAGLSIEFLRQYFKKYTDLILSIVLSISVGIAITLISSGHLHANADAYLFGSMLTVSPVDMAATAILSLLAVLLIAFNYHQLLYITYDEDASRIAGVHVKRLNYLFAFLVAAAISVSIRSVGILVITSMITLPVASALQLQKGFRATFLASLAYSFLSILGGFFISFYIGAAPGGVTALTAAFLLLLTLFVKHVL